MSVTAAYLQQPVLSNVWWTVVLADDIASVEAEKALVLWLNSSLGLLMFLGYREETRGAWVHFKKPILQAMPVIDLRHLGETSVQQLADSYDRVCTHNLSRFSDLATDATRAQIDESVSDALGLPELGSLRTLISREPILSGSLDRLLGAGGV